MTLQLSVICLLTSVGLYAMDEGSTNRLQKALVYAQKKQVYVQQKQNKEIVLFGMTVQKQKEYSDDTHMQKFIELVEHNNALKNNLESYCEKNKEIILVDNLNPDVCSQMGKTTIYMIGALSLPSNHNDGDLFYIRNRIDRLKEEELESPFIIATTEKGMKTLRDYLVREYPDHKIISFPESNGSLFRRPLVIIGGVVAVLGLWCLYLKMKAIRF